MRSAFKSSLLNPESQEGFQAVRLDASNCDNLGADSGWSVQSYCLRGGLQEGVQVVEINNGKLSFSVLPTRGMGIWKGQCGHVSLGWNSPVKHPVHPAFINEQDRGGLGWLKGFNEWFVRCGLNSMGPPGIDTVLDNSGNAFEVPLTLHGKIANQPAHSVDLEVNAEGIVLSGEVDETMMLGPSLRLHTEFRTDFGSGKMTITDTVTNLGDNPQEHEMLYHINYGQPLLEEGSRLVVPFEIVAPRDPRSTEGIDQYDRYGASEAGFVEQVYFFKLIGKPDNGETMAMLRNAAGDRASLLRYTLDDFPCFTLWKNTAGEADGYVTGMEPATSFPNSRRFEREKGRVMSLAGGEARTTRISIETLDTGEAVTAAEAEIQALQETTKGKVLREPDPGISG
jgi:hypothetical protein